MKLEFEIQIPTHELLKFMQEDNKSIHKYFYNLKKNNRCYKFQAISRIN